MIKIYNLKTTLKLCTRSLKIEQIKEITYLRSTIFVDQYNAREQLKLYLIIMQIKIIYPNTLITDMIPCV